MVDVKCPQCGTGDMHPQGADSADLVDRTSSTSGVNATAASKHARDIQDKVDEHGLVYTCASCGYHMRHKPADAGGDGETGDPAAAGETGEARGRRAKK